MNNKNLLTYNGVNYTTIFQSYMHSFLNQDEIVRNLFHDIKNLKIKDHYNLDSSLKKKILNEFLLNNKINTFIKTKINSRENKFFFFKLKNFLPKIKTIKYMSLLLKKVIF